MAKHLIMMDDGYGFGDQIACCPNCKKPFYVPFRFKGTVCPCIYCHTFCIIPGRELEYEEIHKLTETIEKNFI